MSGRSVEVAHQQLSVREAPRRRVEEHLGVHFPRALALLTRVVLTLPPRSPLRARLLRRVVQQGIEAANRGDYASAFALYHPDVEMVVPPDLTAVGFEPAVRGREARMRFEVRWRNEWGDYSYEPEELRDLSDRVFVAGRIRGSGPSSGAAFDREWANVFTLSAGWVVHERVFFDRREALESVGLAEAAPTGKP